MASFTSTTRVNSSPVTSGVLALAAKFSAMVSPRLVISTVRLCCCWRKRNRPTRTTARTTSEVMSRLSLAFSDSRIPMSVGRAAPPPSSILTPAPSSLPEAARRRRVARGDPPPDGAAPTPTRLACHPGKPSAFRCWATLLRHAEGWRPSGFLPDGLVAHLPEHFEEGPDHARVPEAGIRLPPQDRDRLLMRQRGLVGAHRVDGIVDIDHRDDPRAERDGLALEPVRVAGAVPLLVVVAHDGPHRLQTAKPQHQVGAHARMGPHALLLARLQRASFQEDAVGYRDLAQV